MKYVINNCFGGFSIKKSIAEEYGFDRYREARDNKKLINLIESGINCNGTFANLVVVTIPDDATDFELNNYDGYETIICVVNGKIHHL